MGKYTQSWMPYSKCSSGHKKLQVYVLCAVLLFYHFIVLLVMIILIHDLFSLLLHLETQEPSFVSKVPEVDPEISDILD